MEVIYKYRGLMVHAWTEVADLATARGDATRS
jgi:hypothetical protein